MVHRDALFQQGVEKERLVGRRDRRDLRFGLCEVGVERVVAAGFAGALASGGGSRGPIRPQPASASATRSASASARNGLGGKGKAGTSTNDSE